MSRTRWITLSLALVLSLAGLGGGAALAGDPGRDRAVDRIDLPQGYQPEGITTDGRRLYVGSLADGALLRADPRTGNTHVLPQSPTGTPAVGVEYDEQRDVLWVAGGPAGEVRAHDASSGRLLATYTFPGSVSRFVNDVVVTEDALYATDSQNAELGVVELTDADELPPSGDGVLLPLTGDFQLEEGFNANGIARLEDEWLVLVQSNTGLLFRVDPATGETRAFDLGGVSLVNGDGLETDDDTVYVVRNRDNLVVVLEVEDDDLTGELLAELTDPGLDVPTTAALVGDDLYAVNARFGNPAPETAEYWITRLDAVTEDDEDDDGKDDEKDDDSMDGKDDEEDEAEDGDRDD